MTFSASTMRVTPRDREIFHKVTVEGRSQRSVGGEYKLTQPRVAAIVKRLRRWSEQPLPQGLGEACRAERLAGLARVHRMRLHLYRDLALEAFRQSQNVHIVKQFFDADGKKIKEERTGMSAGGTVRFLEFARKFDERLLEFDGVAKDGSVDLKAKDRLPDVPGLTRDEMMEDIDRYVKSVTPMLDEWKGEKEVEKGVRSSDCGVRSEEASASASVGASARRGQEVRSAEDRRLDLRSDRPEEVHAGSSRPASSPPPPNSHESGYGPAVISEQVTIALSESLSRVGAGNSAVESALAGVIAAVIAVINVLKSVIKTQPTGDAKKVGPEVQPTGNTKPVDDFFLLFRNRLPRMHVEPPKQPRIRVQPAKEYPLTEEVY